MRTLLIYIWLCIATINTLQSQEVPEVIPPSPTAASLGKYGVYPVNYATGLPSIEIPLYEIKVGEYNLPVKLSYHASGIKVSEEASWVGLGWSLFYGGSLTRTVHGLPDDQGGYLDAQLLHISDIHDIIQNDPYNFTYMKELSSPGNYASTPDLYYFNLNGGESGKFMIDRNLDFQLFPPKPVQINRKNLALGVLGTYQIIDKNGVKFDFGIGNTAKEKTYMLHPFGEPNNYNYVSTWHLSKIAIPNGNEISFEYQEDGVLDQRNVMSQSYSITEKQCPGINTEQYENCSVAYEFIDGTYEDRSSMDYVETSKLEKIVFPNGRLIFHFGDEKRLDLLSKNGIGLNYLARIDIQKKVSEGIYDDVQSIVFAYSYFVAQNSGPIPSNGKRLRLDSVTRISHIDGKTETIAQFEYHNDNLPAKDSYSVDYFGYHNGANNTNLIPKHYKTFINGGYIEVGSSNRKVNPNAISAYTLKSITYPTKGKTEFILEPNQYYGTDIFEDFQEIQESISIVGNGNGEQQPEGLLLEEDYCINTLGDLCSDCCFQTQYISFTIQEPTSIELNFNRTNINELAHWDKYSYGKIKLFHNGQNVLATYPGVWGGNVSYSTSKLISLNPGNYHVELTVWGDNIYASASVRYIEQFGDQNNYAGGLRIQAIINKNKDGSVINKKNYEYNTFIDDEKTSGRLTSAFKPIYFSQTTNYKITFIPPPPELGELGISECDYIKNTTTSYHANAIAGIKGNTVLYENVREYEGTDKNANGYTDYRFTFNLNDEFIKELPSLDTSWKRGELISKAHYKIVANEPLLLQKTENLYEDFNSLQSQIKAFKLNRYGDVDQNCNLRPDVALSGLYYPAEYTYSSKARYMSSSNTTHYFYDANNVLLNSTETLTKYYYDNPEHLQLTRTVTTTSDDKPIITKIFYPDDVIATTSLGSDPLTTEEFNSIDILKKQTANNPSRLHRIAEYVQLEIYKDLNEDEIADANELMSRRRNNYKVWYDNVVLPEDIRTSKDGDPMEDRIVYANYDDFGNPLELSKADGTLVSYIWGYQQTKPIAKLEGISYADIDPATIANLQTLSDNDTDTLSEQTLRDALHLLYDTYPDATIITFTYDPLVGITSMTDPKGYTSFYTYDDFNRLAATKDTHSDIMEAYNYNYAQEALPAYTPLNVAIDYGSHTNDHQWFTASPDGGSGDFSYAWFEGVDDSSTNFEAASSGTNDTYQFMVSCGQVRYVKLVVTDIITGEIVEAVKANNNSCNYSPLTVGIDYGSHTNDHQWFTVNLNGGSGDFSYAWFEGIGNSPIAFEASPSGTNDTYQFMVNCGQVRYVKLVVTDTTTGEIVEAVKASNNTCEYPPLTGGISYGPDNDTSQWFLSTVNGGSGNYSYAWYKGIGGSNVNFENTPSSTATSYQMPVPCTTLKYVKLVITDTVTGLTINRVKVSDNHPCMGNGNEQQ